MRTRPSSLRSSPCSAAATVGDLLTPTSSWPVAAADESVPSASVLATVGCFAISGSTSPLIDRRVDVFDRHHQLWRIHHHRLRRTGSRTCVCTSGKTELATASRSDSAGSPATQRAGRWLCRTSRAVAGRPSPTPAAPPPRQPTIPRGRRLAVVRGPSPSRSVWQRWHPSWMLLAQRARSTPRVARWPMPARSPGLSGSWWPGLTRPIARCSVGRSVTTGTGGTERNCIW